MALELFKPFIFHRLIDYQEVHTIKNAKRKLEENDPRVWAILEEVVKNILFCSTVHRPYTASVSRLLNRY
ncbi:MAG: hypothetical protein CM15mP45_03440 [Deltaproteobacteria bacterium]|nr:MAG: hypothetical protein CM15mP45_03440 [Deltaproteobacteria bacterium]